MDVMNFDENILFDYLASEMGQLVEYLEKESENQVTTTYGAALKPFGIGKLRIVESVLYMVKLNVHKVSFELGLKKIFQVLMVSIVMWIKTQILIEIDDNLWME